MAEFIYKAIVALDGTTWTTLVTAPPEGVVYRIRNVYAQNTAGAARILTLALNENGTRSVIWKSGSTGDTDMFTQTAGGERNFPVDIALTNTDETLDMQLDNTGTDRVVCFYETETTEFP